MTKPLLDLMQVNIRLIEDPDLAELESRWQELEQRADGSFFQSWIWTGCLIDERYPSPLLLQATLDGKLALLALFNRHRGRFQTQSLFLGESGNSALDAIFIEHNGPLVIRDFADRLLPACLARVLVSVPASSRSIGRVVMSGVGDDVLEATRQTEGVVGIRQSRLAPVLDLRSIREKGSALLDGVSANTRYQIRRAERQYRQSGPLTIRHAQNAAESHRMLDALATLHQRTWEARGHPGAFANRDFIRFHHALIDRAMPFRAVDLLEISAGARIIGYLLNFVWRGRIYAYQSGFDYALAHAHEKPGLVCHHQAMDMYLAEGLDSYDFMAKADRYKTSFAKQGVLLHWIVLAPRWSQTGIRMRVQKLLGRNQ